MVLEPAADSGAVTASQRWRHVLKWLVLATVAGSILHYADNLLFFEQYPEPAWIDRSIIDAFWILMTPLAWIGYRLIQHGSHHAGTFVLLIYAVCNLLTLGHYLYAPMHEISMRIHVLILFEAVLAGLLVAFLFLPYLKRSTP